MVWKNKKKNGMMKNHAMIKHGPNNAWNMNEQFMNALKL